MQLNYLWYLNVIRIFKTINLRTTYDRFSHNALLFYAFDTCFCLKDGSLHVTYA